MVKLGRGNIAMNKDNFTIEEQALIQRLRNAPQPELSNLTKGKIQQQLWNELDSYPSSKPRPSNGWSMQQILILIILVVIALVIGFLAAQSLPRDSELTTPSATLPITQAQTNTLANTPTIISLTSQATNTDTSNVSPTPIPTMTAPTIVETLPAPLVVIEGSVQAIGLDTLQIFDIEIQVEPSDPILTEIRIGDTVRIEGQSSLENNTIVIVAVDITIIETTVIIVNEPGVVYVPVGLPANCKRTKKGNVTCKNSRRS